MTATDKLAGIKPGDRVRWQEGGSDNNGYFVHQVEGVVEAVSPNAVVVARSHPSGGYAAVSLANIERLESQLRVGDRVRLSDARARGMVEAHGRVIAVAPNYAWVEWPLGSAPTTHILPDLERIA